MEFLVLGPLEVRANGRPLALGPPKQRALLAMLLLRGNEVVTADALVDGLWGEAPPPSAFHLVEVYVSQLRGVLRRADAAGLVVTRRPGYVLEAPPGSVDLHRFEELAGEGARAFAAEQWEESSDRLSKALALWRGPALVDLAREPFARIDVGRLEELRLAAVERRIEADLALGRHFDLVPELEALVAQHPLREHLRAQLMLALYRSGRQRDALAAYREARASLVDELGLEPSDELRQLEGAILRHEPSLASDRQTRAVQQPPPERSIVVAGFADESLDALAALAAPLARAERARELILARVARDEAELAGANESARATRERLLAEGVQVRAVAYVSHEPTRRLARIVSEQSVDLLLVECPSSLVDAGRLTGAATNLLAAAPCDVALVVARRVRSSGLIVVPFTGAPHDWAAVELAAWLARAEAARLALLGSASVKGRRDASESLATASLLVQRFLGLAADPVLVEPRPEALVAAAAAARAVVLGLPEARPSENIGGTRLALIRDARPPVLVVRRGVRPGGLAPPEALTRFTWSVAQAR